MKDLEAGKKVIRMKKQTVTCDKCGAAFPIKKTKKNVFTDGERGKVHFHYFVCPKCLEKYPFHVESDEINQLIAEKKKLYLSTAAMKSKSDVDAAFKQMNDLERKIKARQAEYKLLFKLDS